MRILLVGAGGVGAAFAAIAARRDFFEQSWSPTTTSAARRRPPRPTRASSRRRSTPRRAESVAALAREHAVTHVMNAVDPRFVMPIFEGAFAAGADYLDMAMSLSRPHPEAPYSRTGVKLGDEQFAQATAWEESGRLALVGIGVEPGLSDVFARYAADHLFSEIDELGTRDGVEPHRRRLRVRAVVLDLDHDRGVPQPAAGLGAVPGGRGRRLVHHRAVQRAGDLRLPRRDRPGRVRERGARGGRC